MVDFYKTADKPTNWCKRRLVTHGL